MNPSGSPGPPNQSRAGLRQVVHDRCRGNGEGTIYNDGNTMTLSLCGSLLEKNEVNSFGSGIFFVSNDHTGNVVIKDSVIRG